MTMATAGVMCSVVHLAQQPPPVSVPPERVALPTPIHRNHTPGRRSVRDSHGGFRWHKPAFQPFQLKPWMKDADMDQEMKQSLAVVAPHHLNELPTFRNGHQRSLTAPPATVSSFELRREANLQDRKVPPKTAHATSESIRNLIQPSTRRSVATFPARPPISREKQIPGRFFPKPCLNEEQKAQLEVFKQLKPRKAASLTSGSQSVVGNSERVQTATVLHGSDSAAPVARMDRQHSASYNRRIARQRQQIDNKERPEIRSEVFAICFKDHSESGHQGYDPCSELHSDYYSIKRLKMPVMRPGRPVKTSTDNFAVVLRGHRKHLHKKFLFDAESQESLIQAEVIDMLDNPAPGSNEMGQAKRTILPDSPRKIIDIETPKATEDKDDDSLVSGDEEIQDQTLAPLNSPTTSTLAGKEQTAFPALT